MRRLFAIIPAAGLSRRMGQPKLLLPLGSATVIAQVLRTLRIPEIVETYVVLRRDDEALRRAVAAEGAHIVQPEVPPPDMRTSIERGLAAIAEQYAPADDEGWLLSPADHPALDRSVLFRLIQQWRATAPRILVPLHQGRRGHPTLFAWSLAREVAGIPQNQGLNWLVRRHEAEIAECPCDSPAILQDMDTPADYERLRQTWRSDAAGEE